MCEGDASGLQDKLYHVLILHMPREPWSSSSCSEASAIPEGRMDLCVEKYRLWPEQETSL